MARKTLLGTIGPLIAVALVVGPLPYVENYSGAAESDDPSGDAAAAKSDEDPFGTAPKSANHQISASFTCLSKFYLRS